VASILNPKLHKATDLLLKGEVVAIPTETVYGLAASIESHEGLKKIFALKERPFFDPLIVHIANFKQAASLTTDWLPLADYLTRTFWPGPFTVVLPRADHVDTLITSGLNTVAIRYPAHPLTQELIHLVGPLAAPSANKFGHTSPTQPRHVQDEFPGSHLLILDGGNCEVGVESTVASIEAEHVRILRPGAVTEEMILTALVKWSHPVSVTRESSQASPGSLKHHYMPKIPVVIVQPQNSTELSADIRLRIQNELGMPAQNAVELKLNDDPAIAARELYSEMRKISESNADCIYVVNRPERQGMWSAIWDRLSRAASLDLSS
jgi:L-threonylcarbamoyladenylate synthase